MYSPDQVQNIALPTSGTATYNLVGNTSPTDNLGNVGILGTANLSADFTAQTVATDMAIGFDYQQNNIRVQQVWNGAGASLPIASDGGFAGSLDSVNVNIGSAVIPGTGTAAGLFTNNADGAGMGFSLEADINGVDTTVSGTAVFQKN